MNGAGPATNPPSAPSVLERVPTRRTSTPSRSGSGPSTACASSSTSRAACRAHTSASCSIGATSPSIENTVSVTTTARPDRSASNFSRCSTSPWRYTATSARESRQPSTIDAWFSSSEHTRVPAPPKVVSTPRLVANPVGNSTARAAPFHAASSASSSAWIGREPTMSRAAPDPAPQRSIASWAAAITAGCWVSPR